MLLYQFHYSPKYYTNTPFSNNFQCFIYRVVTMNNKNMKKYIYSHYNVYVNVPLSFEFCLFVARKFDFALITFKICVQLFVRLTYLSLKKQRCNHVQVRKIFLYKKTAKGMCVCNASRK